MKILKTLIQEASVATDDPFQETKPSDQELLLRLVRKSNAIWDYSQSLQRKYAAIRSKPKPPFVQWTHSKPATHVEIPVYSIRTKNSESKVNLDTTYVYLDTTIATPEQVTRINRDVKLSEELAETYRLLIGRIKRLQKKPVSKPDNMSRTFPIPGRPGYNVLNPAVAYDKGTYVGPYDGYMMPSNLTPAQESVFLSFCKKHLGIDKSNMVVYAGIGVDPNAYSSKPKSQVVVVINGGQMLWRILGKSGGYVYFPDGKRYIVDHDIASYDRYVKQRMGMSIEASVAHFKQLNAGTP